MAETGFPELRIAALMDDLSNASPCIGLNRLLGVDRSDGSLEGLRRKPMVGMLRERADRMVADPILPGIST